MKIKLDNSGISLAITIGLLFVLVTLTATVSQLVIRALRASHQIEASDKAYFAAEAGIEDALYELSAHSAGYETVDLIDSDARTADFTETVEWRNQWDIKNRGLNTCEDELGTWETTFTPDYCGRIFPGQKLVLNLFNDTAQSVGVSTDRINTADANIETLSIDSFEMKLRLPKGMVLDNTLTNLYIDNDGDYDPITEEGLNEDGHVDFGFGTNTCPYSGLVEVDDNDCDSREDEDSPEDPVILWKLIDDTGRTFQPLRGCKGDESHISHDNVNSTLCEKNFTLEGLDELGVVLDGLFDTGYDSNDPSGTYKTLNSFLSGYAGNNKLQMEILVVAPMETVDLATGRKIPIPYYEYGINFPDGIETDVPGTSFQIRSDGFFRDFKQSITTNVVPRATTRLLDLTIIQQ